MSSSFRDRLSMLDEHGNRRFIIPAEVRGKFQAWKKKTHFALLILFLILPWISIEGEQAVRLNIPDRQFHILGLHLFAHDAPLVFFVLFSFAMGLALATALFGRVWCGWACPQTVFIESVYRRIEIWTEGTYLQRRHLRMGPWNFERIRKVSVKWLLYTFVSMLIAHSFLAYWTGSRELLQMMGGRPSENQTYFLMVMGMTGLLLFN
ncbi:MAG: 4Fe-4S binding protein, partial [Pseudobdellovibrionaceae bacterium]